MWTYRQATGELIDAFGRHVATGYSGFGPGKNAASWQDHPDVGPIPCGSYTIESPIDLGGGPHGPFVLPLVPDAANRMYGRSGFLIHGDSKTHAGSASHGCMIFDRLTRETIATSNDNRLTVTSGLPTPEIEP